MKPKTAPVQYEFKIGDRVRAYMPGEGDDCYFEGEIAGIGPAKLFTGMRYHLQVAKHVWKGVEVPWSGDFYYASTTAKVNKIP